MSSNGAVMSGDGTAMSNDVSRMSLDVCTLKQQFIAAENLRCVTGFELSERSLVFRVQEAPASKISISRIYAK